MNTSRLVGHWGTGASSPLQGKEKSSFKFNADREPAEMYAPKYLCNTGTQLEGYSTPNRDRLMKAEQKIVPGSR